MRDTIQEINADYNLKLEELKAKYHYDEFSMTGRRVPWKEVLSVYAVFLASDPDSPVDVVTMDPDKAQLLKAVFWDMIRLEPSTRTVITVQQKTETDENGNEIVTETEVRTVYLTINVTSRSAYATATSYGFSDDRMDQLRLLLSDDCSDQWMSVIYGAFGADERIVSVTLSQVGNIGGAPYWSWYGFNSRVSWCACFVSWCANECGYLDDGTIPKFASCKLGTQWFKGNGRWMDGSEEPYLGCIIFFDWADGGQDGEPEHVGIVEYTDRGIVHTIEGNSGNACVQREYPVGYYEILGYGTPEYPN